MNGRSTFRWSGRRQRARWCVGGVLLATIVATACARSVFVLGASEACIVTAFGRVVCGPILEAGAHLKRPWERAHVVDCHVQLLTFQPREVVTGACEPLTVMPYALWRVHPEGAERYLAATADDGDLQIRLRSLIWSALDEAVASHALADWIRAATATEGPTSPASVALLEPVRDRCREEADRFGVQIVDVGLQRLARPGRMAEAIERAMRTEGRRIVTTAQLAASARAAEIEVDARRQADAIVTGHLREAEHLRAEGQQEAAKIYDASYRLNPELARVVEQLQILRKLIMQASDRGNEVETRTDSEGGDEPAASRPVSKPADTAPSDPEGKAGE